MTSLPPPTPPQGGNPPGSPQGSPAPSQAAGQAPDPLAPIASELRSLRQDVGGLHQDLGALHRDVTALKSDGRLVPLAAALLAGLGAIVAGVVSVLNYWNVSAIERELKEVNLRASEFEADRAAYLAERERREKEIENLLASGQIQRAMEARYALSVFLDLPEKEAMAWSESGVVPSGAGRGVAPWESSYVAVLDGLRKSSTSIASIASFCLEVLEPLEADQISMREGVPTYTTSFRSPWVQVVVELGIKGSSNPACRLRFEEIFTDARGPWRTRLNIAFDFQANGSPHSGVAKFRDPRIAEWARASGEGRVCGRRLVANPQETRWGDTTIVASDSPSGENSWDTPPLEPTVFPSTLGDAPVLELRQRIAELLAP